MESIQVTAIRVCGAATCALLLVVCAGFVSRFFDTGSLPPIHTAGGAAFLVSLIAFIVANVPNAATARSVCAGSAAVIAVVAVLRVYVVMSSSSRSHILDGLLSIAILALLVPLYRSVWGRSPGALAA